MRGCEFASRISPRGRAKTYSIAFVLDRLLFACKTGCQRNQLTTEQCSYKTIFHYFSKWSKARLFEDVFYELAGRIQCERAVVDTSFVADETCICIGTYMLPATWCRYIMVFLRVEKCQSVFECEKFLIFGWALLAIFVAAASKCWSRNVYVQQLWTSQRRVGEPLR